MPDDTVDYILDFIFWPVLFILSDTWKKKSKHNKYQNTNLQICTHIFAK